MRWQIGGKIKINNRHGVRGLHLYAHVAAPANSCPRWARSITRNHRIIAPAGSQSCVKKTPKAATPEAQPGLAPMVDCALSGEWRRDDIRRKAIQQ